MKEIADRGVEELSENGNAKEKFGDWRETNATLDNNKVSVNYSSQFCSSTYYNNFFRGDKSPKIMSFENCIEELICFLCLQGFTSFCLITLTSEGRNVALY